MQIMPISMQVKLQPNMVLYLRFPVFPFERFASPSVKIDYDTTDLFLDVSVIIEEPI